MNGIVVMGGVAASKHTASFGGDFGALFASYGLNVRAVSAGQGAVLVATKRLINTWVIYGKTT